MCFSSRQAAKRKLPQYGPEDPLPNAPTTGPLPLRDPEDVADFSSVDEPESHALALALAGAANDTKAVDIALLDVASVVTWTRYFVICTCFSRPQVDACVSRMTTAAEAPPLARTLAHTPAIGAPPRRRRRRRQRQRATASCAVLRPNAHLRMCAGGWVCLDYGDVVAHVFTPADRDFYDLSGYYAKATQARTNARWPVPRAQGVAALRAAHAPAARR